MEVVFNTLGLALLLLFPIVSGKSNTNINSFIPQRLACPEELRIRPSEHLSSSEIEWRATRLPRVVESVKGYLTRVNIPGFDTMEYFRKLNHTNVPIIGLSISGGGSTSGIGGLGVWQAFDEKYEPARQAGTAGIAQSLTYLTGLSGGGFLTVSTLASNQFNTIDDIRKAVNFSEDYTTGPSGDQADYIEDSISNAVAKQESGFPVSITDIFGQWLGTYLPEGWKNNSFSDLARLNTSFSNGTGPMPILGLAEVIPGRSPKISNILYPGRNSTNGFNLTEYEVTPFEFGSWYGGRVQGFMPLEWLGSAMRKGTPSGRMCVTDFDRFTFLQGSTANAWNIWLIQDFDGTELFAKRDSPRVPEAGLLPRQDVGAPDDVIIPLSKDDDFQAIFLNTTADALGQSFNDTLWAWVPNPFEDYNDAMMGVSDLLLVDGSEAGETDPLRPLMVPQRNVDLIIVYEASTDAPYYNCQCIIARLA
ncbi:hypothetical protein N0V93_007961 [Gnomoniopsis smithogilvyi]|uniref:Lysophospholipase n=1 Tax=Gnomoniopsis smithogilvyi TaxID=1191159 RepID=A0A9W8YP47_9PEZI|nr:hypothetical protein N0V93_007961 [Gnomoniopsis smithogilvyi]